MQSLKTDVRGTTEAAMFSLVFCQALGPMGEIIRKLTLFLVKCVASWPGKWLKGHMSFPPKLKSQLLAMSTLHLVFKSSLRETCTRSE